ncbi:TetR/AcrR family transcriptional regulator [bacterium]|nr:TetR/AcrR family transcriptional regulator [bacterium]
MTSEERKAWERKQRETRIIDIAQQVLFEYGYENATILQIAKSAGYNKRTMYLYFKDKEEIFLAVVLRGLEILSSMLRSAIEESKDERNQLRKLGEVFFNFSLEHPEFLRLIMIYESNNCIYHKELKSSTPQGVYLDACQNETDAIADIMTSTLKRAKDNGTIKTELTPVQLMLILWGEVFGVMQIILMRREHFKDAFGISYHQLFEAFMNMVVAAISPGD